MKREPNTLEMLAIIVSSGLAYLSASNATQYAVNEANRCSMYTQHESQLVDQAVANYAKGIQHLERALNQRKFNRFPNTHHQINAEYHEMYAQEDIEDLTASTKEKPFYCLSSPDLEELTSKKVKYDTLWGKLTGEKIAI